ncbi:MAG: response regulator transcription factor, partial [Verrucomicrobiae bacterium]|nr:response regulator transcription factor [Verrucomicrobiae bacterium]
MKKKTPIRLLIVDDHPAFRAGLAALCQSEPDLEVVAEGGDGHQAVALYRQFKPDIALMDLRLPGLGGVEAIIAIRAEFPEARVIVVTTYDGDEDLYRAIQSGAQGYLLKDMSKAEIVDHIRAIHAGQSRLAPHLAERLAERRKRRDLSQRELEVLQLVVKGRSNKEIAAALFLSEETVKFHLKTLFTKLDVQDRT